MKRKEKRSKKYVDKAVQGAVLRRFLFHSCLFMMVGSLLSLVVQFLSDPFQGVSALTNQFWQKAGPFIVVFLALLPIFVWDTIKLTNRIVGPMCRVRSTLHRANAGDRQMQPLEFRSGDFWGDLADELNTTVKRLQDATKESSPESLGEQEPERAAV